MGNLISSLFGHRIDKDDSIDEIGKQEINETENLIENKYKKDDNFCCTPKNSKYDEEFSNKHFLETNLDYTETNLDEIIQMKTMQMNPTDLLHRNVMMKNVLNENYNVSLLEDPRSPTIGVTRTPIEIVTKKQKEIIQTDLLEKINNATDDTKLSVEFTEISQNEESKNKTSESSVMMRFNNRIDQLTLEDAVEKIIEDLETDATLSSETSNESNIEEFISEIVETMIPKEVVTVEAKNQHTPNFGTNQINSKMDKENCEMKNGGGFKKTDELMKLKASSKNRTPLSSVGNKQNNSLKKYSVSKIPVFKKDKHCENTPPSGLNSDKNMSKLIQWDTDNTVII